MSVSRVDWLYPVSTLDAVVTPIPMFVSNLKSPVFLVITNSPINAPLSLLGTTPVSPSVLTPTVEMATLTLEFTLNPW